MTRLVAVVDTNVVVSGLLSSGGDSPPARVLDLMLAGGFSYLLSVELLTEYREVLLRPRIRNVHGLGEREIDTLLAEVAALGRLRSMSQACEGAPDPGDDHLWSLLSTTRGSVLVTGDRRLLDQPPSFASVVNPREFLGLVGSERSFRDS